MKRPINMIVINIISYHEVERQAAEAFVSIFKFIYNNLRLLYYNLMIKNALQNKYV